MHSIPSLRMTRLALLLLLLALAAPARAVEVPEAGKCPPYPVHPGPGEVREEDVVPPAFRPGETLDLEGTSRLRDYLPSEVWERRELFFFDGMRLEIGPCHRRYPAPAFFEEATRQHAGQAKLDPEGNLIDYAGAGLPFPPESIPGDAPDAGWKWAWNYRYRYAGSGFRGRFQILHVMDRGRKIHRYGGDVFFLPLHGLPESGNGDEARFVAGGEFRFPNDSRGVAWRQYRSSETDGEANRSDEVFLWVPEERRVRRAPPYAIDGLFMPSYTRGSSSGSGKLVLPDATISTPDQSIATGEHWRRGFTGLYLRPNAYRFTLAGVRDVIAPMNSMRWGYPSDDSLSYGPSGLSVASDRWDIRRAVVLHGARKVSEANIGSVTLYVDALTAQPLYFVSRRPNHGIQEVGIFVGRFSGDDPLAPKWTGSGKDFGVILPVAEVMFVAGGESWLRESYELRSDPPAEDERSDLESTITLQKSGR